MSKVNTKSRILVSTDSTAISSIEYNANLKRLTVLFKNSGVYQYENVPPEVFGELASTTSLGAAVNSLIVGHYESSRLITPEYGVKSKA